MGRHNGMVAEAEGSRAPFLVVLDVEYALLQALSYTCRECGELSDDFSVNSRGLGFRKLKLNTVRVETLGNDLHRMDPYNSPYTIPQNCPNNPFPHSLLRTRPLTTACPNMRQTCCTDRPSRPKTNRQTVNSKPAKLEHLI